MEKAFHQYSKSEFKLQALLSEKEKSILSQYQPGDELLYKEFKNILSKKVEVYGKEKIKQVCIFVLEKITNFLT